MSFHHMGKLAVIFPGIGYTADKPLLYFSRSVAASLGYEIRLIRYDGFPRNVMGDPDRMAECYRLALSQALEQLSDRDLTGYNDIVFIGKSIGTILAAKFAAKSAVRERIRLILYTPMEDTFLFPLGSAIVFTGTADPWVGGADSRIPALCREKGAPCIVIPGGNHSLETGAPPDDLHILQTVMEKTARFMEVAGSKA